MPNEIIIECKGLSVFHINEDNEKLLKTIIKLCEDYHAEVKYYRQLAR